MYSFYNFLEMYFTFLSKNIQIKNSKLIIIYLFIHFKMELGLSVEGEHIEWQYKGK